MRKDSWVSLLVLLLVLGGTCLAASKLSGYSYTYPQVVGQDPQVQTQDPHSSKLTDGKVAIGGPGAVWTAWDWPSATVLFDLGELPGEFLINQIKIKTSEDFAHQHLAQVEVYSGERENFAHVATIRNPEKKLAANPATKKVYSFGTENLQLSSRYVMLVFHKDSQANHQIIEEVEFWAEEPQKLPFGYTYPPNENQDPNVYSQDPQLKKLNDGGKLWGGSTAIYGSWGAAEEISINIDFGKPTILKEILLWTSEDNPNQHLGHLKLYTSADGEHYTFFSEMTNPEPPLEAKLPTRKLYSIGARLVAETRFVKLVITREPGALQQVLEEIEFFGFSTSPQLTKELPSASIKSVKVNTYSSLKVDLGDYLARNPEFTDCRVYLGEDFFNDAQGRLAYRNWWWQDANKQVLIINGLTPGQEYFLAVGGETATGSASRCLQTISVQLPEVMATQSVGDVLGINAFPYFASGSAHNPRPPLEEEAMFQKQLQWVGEAQIKYNRWWSLDQRGIRPYLDVGTTFLTWLPSDSAKIQEANQLGIWLFASPNEPNLIGITPQELVARLREGYQVLKAVNPQNILAAPVIHGIEAERWLREFYQAGGKEYFDLLDIHMYQQRALPVPEGLPPGSPEGVLLQLERVREIMAEFGDENKPIIITETGCPTYSGNYWAVKSTPQQQANFVVRAHLHMIANGVQRIFWYALQDEGTDPDKMEENFGLIDYHGNPKPAYWAYKTMAEQLGETVYSGALPGLANPYFGYAFKKNYGYGYVSCLWDAAGTSSAQLRMLDGQVLIVRRDGASQVLANPTSMLEVEISEAPLYIHSSGPVEVIKIERN